MFARAFRQSSRYTTAFCSVQQRQLNHNNIIIPNFTHHVPILQSKLSLTTNLVSNLPAEVQQMLLELATLDEEDLPVDDERGLVGLKNRLF